MLAALFALCSANTHHFKAVKTLLDEVNVEDRGCTEKVFKGLLSDNATPGHLSHLERPNYDFATYLASHS